MVSISGFQTNVVSKSEYVGKLVTDCHIENRHAAATGTWEFYPSYATNKTTKAPVEKAKPAPKKEAAPKKQFVPKKEPVVEEKKEPEKKSSGFFANRDKKKKGGNDDWNFSI